MKIGFWYWLVIGDWSSCVLNKECDQLYLQQLFNDIGFKKDKDYTINEKKYIINNIIWNKLEMNIPCTSLNCNTTSIASMQIAPWIYTLPAKHVKYFVKGLIKASSSNIITANVDTNSLINDTIITSDIQRRDDLMRVFILAGYSPHFCRSFETRYQKDITDNSADIMNWKMTIDKCGEDIIDTTCDISTSEIRDTVYCLTVPNNLVFAQTALVEDNIIVECSKTVIIGQCAGWGDIDYINRWTMEITNNSRYHHIPLVVNRRIAQIIFFVTEGTDGSYADGGKYQTNKDLDTLIAEWKPSSCLPRLFCDREIYSPSNP